MIVADGAPGLIKAVEQCWPASDRQHCAVQEWDAFMDDFHQTLAKFSVPDRERGELDAIVESTKDDIVTSPAPAA